MTSMEEEDIEMATTSTAPTDVRKRKAESADPTIIVDPDNTDLVVGTAKKPKIELDEELKTKCIQAAILAYLNILELAKLPVDAFYNLDVSTQISGIIFSCHSILRQEANGTLQELKNKAEKTGFKITFLGKTYPVNTGVAIETIKAAFSSHKLEYKKFDPKQKENWYGTAGPYLNFFTGYGLRRKELRLGHAQMSVGKEEGKSKTFMVEKYGIHGGHHILLEGCTFPPEKRSSMVQSLGPMTILLQYIRSETRYLDKWKAAAKRTFAFIPEIDQILVEIHKRPASEIKAIVSLIADIARITTTRQATRAFLPLCMVAYTCAPRALLKDKTKCITKTVNIQSGPVELGPSLTKTINFSGHGAFLVYYLCSSVEWQMNGSWTAAEASQIAYHSIFGTFKEDLGVLSKVTNMGNWHTREELGNKFQKIGTSEVATRFKLISQKIWSKLTSASQTKILAGNYYQDSSLPCFSGKRKVSYAVEFFENIARKTGKSSTGKSLPQLTELLSKTLDDMVKEIMENGNSLAMGTTDWYDMSGIGVESKGNPTGDIIETTGLHFLGRRR